jgi:hypothetical protein
MFYKRLFYKYTKNIYNQNILKEKNKYTLSRRITTINSPGGGNNNNNNNIFIISLIVGFFILFKNKSY